MPKCPKCNHVWRVPGNIRAHAIAKLVAESYELPMMAMVSMHKNDARSVEARRVAYLLCYEFTSLRDEQIAEVFERNRSTIPGAILNIQKQLQHDNDLLDRLGVLRSKLRVMEDKP